MTAPSAPYRTPARGDARPVAFGGALLETLLLALGLLLSDCSDACVLPPPFEAMEPVNPKSYYDIGETVQYTCKPGYYYGAPFLMVATCEKNHTWVPLTDDGCLKLTCAYLNPPQNGITEYMNGTHKWGDVVRFHCNDGFYRVGERDVYCEFKGNKPTWSSSVPRCEKVQCTSPPSIKNGNYTFNDVKVFEYLEAVTYSCHPAPGPDEFSLVGESVLYCAGHGRWSSAAPECKVVKCPDPVLKNGKQISGFGKKYYYKATVTFECKKGFYLQGSDTVFCNSNNSWQPPIPKCLKGPKPTHPTKPPVYNYPGYPEPREGLFDIEFDALIIALIVIIAVVAFLVAVVFLRNRYQQYHQHWKKSVHLTDED